MSDANLSNLYYRREAAFAEAVSDHSSGILTATAAANNDTVTIGGVVYTFKTALPSANREVYVGASAFESLQNLAACINAEPGNGSRYFLTTLTPDANVYAEVMDKPTSGPYTMTVWTKILGAATTTTKVMAGGSWSGASTAGGSTPAGSIQKVRFNKESLTYGKDTVESEEIRSDRSIGEIIQVGIGASGGFESELICNALNEFFLAGTMAAAATSGTDVLTCSIDSTIAQTVTTSGAFSAGLQGAKFVRITGFVNAGNNGMKRILSATPTVLTLEPGSLTTNETTVAGVNLAYNYYRNGTTLFSYLLEKEMLAAASLIIYRGMCLDTLTLTAAAKQKVMIAYGFLGYDADRRFAQVGTPVVAASTDPVITSSNNIGFINLEDIGIVSPVTNFSLEIKNNLRGRFSLGRPGTLSPGKGSSNISGKFDCYFDTIATFRYFMAHRKKSLHTYFKDSNGSVISVYCPKIRFTEGNPNIAGLNQDIILPLAFRAVKQPDDATGYQIQIDSVA